MTIELLVEQLQHADPQVRFDAAQKLGASKDTRAVEALAAALPDENSKVQYAAFSGLVKLGDARAAAKMVDLLLDAPGCRVWELMKLNIGLRLRAGLLDMVQRGDEQLAGTLIEALDNPALDVDQQAYIIRLLGRTADLRTLETFIAWLTDADLTTQGAAAEALGWIGDTRAVEPLLNCLGREDATLREFAVEALARLGDRRAFDPLLNALNDESEWVRRSAAAGLGDFGDRRAIEPLAAALNDEEPLVQEAAFESLKKLSYSSYDVEM
jgi:HEAT repeat protein